MKNILILLMLISFAANAQDKHDKIKAYKTAYITEQLDFTSTEAEKFWPVYNVYADKMDELRKTERMEVFQRVRSGIDEITDAEANELLIKIDNIKTKELAYSKELVQNLRTVLSPKKILKLKKAEDDFKKKLLERLRQKRKN